MELRPQQIAGKLLAYDAFSQGHNAVIYCAPTGFGKTVVFSDIAREMLENGIPTMIMCDRVELLDQSKEKLNRNGLHPVVINPDYVDKLSNLYVASVDTLRNRQLPDVGFIIADECHKRTFDKILLHYKNKGTKILGFTATAVRTGSAEIEGEENYSGQLRDVYDSLFIASTVKEQIADGYLVDAEHTSVPMDVSDVKIVESEDGPEYKQSDVFKKFNKPVMYAGCVENYIRFASAKKAVCFNANVAHSKRQCEEFIKAGVPAAHLDGKTNKKVRKQIFDDFKAGRIMVLCNCGVATTGWDEPTIECVIINRLTMSLSLYLQMIGRGGRPCPEIGKDHFIIIDQGSNYIKHGYWDSDRYYDLDTEKMSMSAGVAPMVLCDQCEAFIPASKLQCPFCKQEQERKEPTHAAAKLEQAEFAILDTKKGHKHFKPIAKMDVKELEEFRVHKNYSIGWISRQLLLKGESAVIQYASMKGYARAWVDRQLNQAKERRDNTMSGIWDFIKLNGHLTESELSGFATKKMKEHFSNQEIESMLPDILQAADDYRKGKIDQEGNVLV